MRASGTAAGHEELGATSTAAAATADAFSHPAVLLRDGIEATGDCLAALCRSVGGVAGMT